MHKPHLLPLLVIFAALFYLWLPDFPKVLEKEGLSSVEVLAQTEIESAAMSLRRLLRGAVGKQYSFNPCITVYQVSEKGFAVQANWSGTVYMVDPNLY